MGDEIGLNTEKLRNEHRSNEPEWESIREKIGLKDQSDDELARSVSIAVAYPCKGPHAYTDDQLERLAKALDVDRSHWTIEKLRRYTDEFAAYVGLAIRVERTCSNATRLDELESRLLKPLRQLIATLDDGEFKKEFMVPYSTFHGFDIAGFSNSLKFMETSTSAQMKILRQASSQRKSWDSDLKLHFVQMVHALIECLNPSMRPSRTVQDGKETPTAFAHAVELLAGPLFDRASDDRPQNFDRPIRVFIDGWNREFKELTREAKERKANLMRRMDNIG